MRIFTVNSHGGADFASLAMALASIPKDEPVTIKLANGIYREKIYCEHADLAILGENREGTLLVWDDGAFHRNADGGKNGTFRSYTAFFSGGRVRVKNMTIANTAGDGAVHGQAIAAAVDAAEAAFENVALLSCQDTLFTGPLPERERQLNGFLGPKQHASRIPSRQYYKNCYIRGDIDFIFGGADALFEDCTLHCHNQGENRKGYIAAPSTQKDGLGYVFFNCDIESEKAPAASFYLARPWRRYGKAAFLQCSMSNVIHPDGFDDWNDTENRTTCEFAEYNSSGQGAKTPRAFGKQLTHAEAMALLQTAGALRELADNR